MPDVAARSQAPPTLKPFFDAYPLPNGPDDTDNGIAQFNASFSNPASLDAYSLRIDHKLKDKFTFFGRYNYSPSEITQRSAGGFQALSVRFPSRIATQTATLGAVFVVSPAASNDLRINYSRTDSSNGYGLDDFGGAVPLAAPPFPDPFNVQDAEFSFNIIPLTHGSYVIGRAAENAQRQFNLVDNFALQKGTHAIKFGLDYRRLTPHYGPNGYLQGVFFANVPSALAGNALFAFFAANSPAVFQFQNLGVFGQDTWRVGSRLTLTYGLRWDVDFAPSSLQGPSLPAVTGFNLSDLSNLALAPAGAAPFKTTYGNVAPRVGLAYTVFQKPDFLTVVRGGFGLFFDLATAETGNMLAQASYPFGASKFVFGGNFPFDSTTATPPPITVEGLAEPGSSPLTAFDPNLLLPYTLQWNISAEQALGKQQALSVSYVGSVGRRLIQTAVVSSPNPSFDSAYLVSNPATSDYAALQVRFQRQLREGLQALASYTWSHSIDTASAGSNAVGSNTLVPGNFAASNRGPSDFDRRHVVSLAVTDRSRPPPCESGRHENPP